MIDLFRSPERAYPPLAPVSRKGKEEEEEVWKGKTEKEEGTGEFNFLTARFGKISPPGTPDSNQVRDGDLNP